MRRYALKLSGALADRIDLFLRVAQPSREALLGDTARAQSSATVRKRVVAARERQGVRLGPARCNAEMTPAETHTLVELDPAAQRLLAGGGIRLSARGHDRLLRVARTLADLDESPLVCEAHIGEAQTLRCRDS